METTSKTGLGKEFENYLLTRDFEIVDDNARVGLNPESKIIFRYEDGGPAALYSVNESSVSVLSGPVSIGAGEIYDQVAKVSIDGSISRNEARYGDWHDFVIESGVLDQKIGIIDSMRDDFVGSD